MDTRTLRVGQIWRDHRDGEVIEVIKKEDYRGYYVVRVLIRGDGSRGSVLSVGDTSEWFSKPPNDSWRLYESYKVQRILKHYE